MPLSYTRGERKQKSWKTSKDKTKKRKHAHRLKGQTMSSITIYTNYQTIWLWGGKKSQIGFILKAIEDFLHHFQGERQIKII